MLKSFYPVVLLFVVSGAFAQTYLEINYGRSSIHMPSPPANTPGKSGNLDIDDRRNVSTFGIGHAFDVFAIESGIGHLGRRLSRNFGPIVSRASPCCDITQDISAKYFYTAVGVHRAVNSSLDLSSFIGRAVVRMHNHEFGTNENGPGQNFDETFSEGHPLVILHARYRLTPQWSVSTSYTGMRNIGNMSTHLGHGNIDIVSIGVSLWF